MDSIHYFYIRIFIQCEYVGLEEFMYKFFYHDDIDLFCEYRFNPLFFSLFRIIIFSILFDIMASQFINSINQALAFDIFYCIFIRYLIYHLWMNIFITLFFSDFIFEVNFL